MQEILSKIENFLPYFRPPNTRNVSQKSRYLTRLRFF